MDVYRVSQSYYFISYLNFFKVRVMGWSLFQDTLGTWRVNTVALHIERNQVMDLPIWHHANSKQKHLASDWGFSGH